MEGVSIVETPVLQELILKINQLSERVESISQELKKAKSPYLNTQEVCEYIKKSENWVLQHKHDLGCGKRTGTLLFKRLDLDEFIDSDYFRKP